jgi:very-short-patch-repair endonuclease
VHAFRNEYDAQWHATLELAGEQHGIVERGQLLRRGVKVATLQGWVRARRLHPLHRGVYAVGRPDITRLGRDLAAVLSAGRGAALSRRSALALWDLRSYHGLPEVTVPTTGRHRRRGVRIHTSLTLKADDVTARYGIRVTTPGRTLRDVKRLLTPSEFENATAKAVRRGLISPRPAALTRTQLEAEFLRLVRRAGLPEPLSNEPFGPYELDFYWPQWRLVVEIDDYETHWDPITFARDRRKDTYVQRHGLRVLRITDLHGVLDDIRALASVI